MGLCAVVVMVAFFDYESLAGLWRIYYPLTGLLMVYTAYFGEVREGSNNRSWLKVPGLTGFQPSELWKFAFILAFAWHLAQVREDLNHPRFLIPVLLNAGIGVGAVMLQRDTGVALVMVAIVAAMLFVAGLSRKIILGAAAAAVVSVPIAWNYLLADFHKERILGIFHPQEFEDLAFQQLEGLDSLGEELSHFIHDICDVAGRTLRIDNVYLEQLLLARIQDAVDYFQLQFLPGMLSQSLTYVKAFASIGGFLVTFLIAAVLLAKDYDNFMNKLLEREECYVYLEIICGIIRYIATFVKAQIIIMSIIGAVAAAALAVSGIHNGLLWGLLAGFLDALPFIGTGVVLVPLSIQQFFGGNYVRGAVCLLVYVACIFIRELLEPRLIGKRIGVSPIAILLSIYAGIKLFGMWGIIGGPLGFIIIYQADMSLERRRGGQE